MGLSRRRRSGRFRRRRRESKSTSAVARSDSAAPEQSSTKERSSSSESPEAADEWTVVEDNRELLAWLDAPEGGDANAKDRDSRTGLHESAPLVRVTGGALTALAQEAAGHATKSKSRRTLVEYAKQWTAFCDWCRRHGRGALPADAATVALFITERAHDVGLSSLGQALSAIAYYHGRARFPSPRHDPVVKEVLEGITRDKGRARRKKDPLTLAKLQRIVPVLSGETAIRDRALLLIGYVAGLRRSELIATHVEHFKRDDLGRGYVLSIPRSKTDQKGEGRLKAIPINPRSRVVCPASALEDWLLVSGIVSGPVFRGIQHCSVTPKRMWGEDVARVVKRWARRAGIEGWENLSGHSLRAGFITDARRQKQSWASITKQTGQTEKTAEGYVREEEVWQDNAAVELFR